MIVDYTGLPMMHGLHVFEALEQKFIPFRFVLCVKSWPSKLASEGYVHSLKLCTVCQSQRVGMVSLSSDHAPLSMAVTSVAVPCFQLSYIPYFVRHCDLQVVKIIMSNQCHEKRLKIKKDPLQTVTVK